MNGSSVARPSPSSQSLAEAFRQDVIRTQRRSDGTISLEAVRYEIPNRFGHLNELTVRYARWNLRCVHLIDPRSDALLAPIYPLDKARNADGRRRVLRPQVQTQTSVTDQAPSQMAPLLRKLLAQYAVDGVPPAYLPKSDASNQETRP
jgi:hypothetical protein